MRTLGLLFVIGCATKPGANGGVFDVDGTPSLAADPGNADIVRGGFLDVTVTNTGTAITGDLAAVITGTGAASFVVAGGTTCSVLAPGGTCTVRVGVPTAASGAAATAQLVIGDASTNATIDLHTDAGTTTGLLFWTPGTAVVDTSGCPGAMPTSYTLTNNTGQKIDNIQVSTNAATLFRIMTTTCGSLDDGKSCDAEVASGFSVTTTNGLLKASGTFASNDVPVGASAVIQPSGAHPCDVALTPTALTFTAAKGTTVGQSLTITNNSATSKKYKLTFDQSVFSDLDGGCDAVQAAGTACMLKVGFAPGAVQTYPGMLTVVDTTTNTLEGIVALTGNGVAQMAFDHLTFDFGMVAVGQASSKQFVLMTVAPAGLITMTPTGPFAVTTNGCTQLPNGTVYSCAIGVTFTPPNVGDAAGKITANAASGDKAMVTFLGAGSAGP